MRNSQVWIWIAVMGLALGNAPWCDAASAKSTVGITIMIPQRHDLSPTNDDAASAHNPIAALMRPSPDPTLHRTTTLIQDDRTATLLVTDVPIL